MSTETTRLIIQKALQKLIREEGYSQVDIFEKFKQLNITISKSSLNNLCTNKSGISLPLLKKAGKGLELIMERDFCLAYNAGNNDFESIQNCSPTPIILDDTLTIKPETPSQGYTIHNGRIDVSDKVNLFNHAHYEIIEIGIRLRSFNSYFSSKRESAFIEPIIQRLEAGVDFKCYIAEPTGGMLRKYIEDRAYKNLREKEVLEDISKTTNELRNLFIRLNRKGYKGQMKLYSYNHFPYFHASVADGETERGIMYISPYLYGISKANSPVIEVAHKEHKTLYKKYWRSVYSFITSKQITTIV